MLDFPVQPARLGEVWVDKPVPNFISQEEIAILRRELLLSLEDAEAAYQFVKCEARLTHAETKDASECAPLLNRQSAMMIQFQMLPYHREKGQVCQSLMPLGCEIHQAIRIKAWENGVHRPALFVQERPLFSDIMLLIRPRIKDGQGLAVFLPTARFDRNLGDALAETLPFEQSHYVNLMHISNAWKASSENWKIKRNRRYALGTVIVVSSIATGGAAAGALMGVGGKLSTLGTITAVFNLGTGITGSAYGIAHALALEEEITALPAGSPAHRGAQVLLILAEAAPYFAGASAGINFLSTIAIQLSKLKILAHFSRRLSVSIKDLNPSLVNQVAVSVNNNVIQLTTALRSHNTNHFLQVIAEIVEEVTKQIRPTPQ